MKNEIKAKVVDETVETYTIGVDTIRLTYILFSSCAELDGKKCYSLTVTAETECDLTSSTAHDITRRRKEALRCFRLITRGLVTPCTLFDVLENIL